MTYKKRARAGYSDGKGYKKESNASERMYEKKVIKEELDQYNQGDDFRYKHKAGAKKKSELERVEIQITSDEKHLRIMLGYRNGSNWFGNRIKSIKNRLGGLKAKLVVIMTKKKENDKIAKK